jgi:hypothetical protein
MSSQLVFDQPTTDVVANYFQTIVVDGIKRELHCEYRCDELEADHDLFVRGIQAV